MIRRAIPSLLVIGLAACAVESTPQSSPGAPPAPAPRVESTAAIVRPAAGWTGVVAAAEAVDLGPAFDGVLAEVRVRPGDRVTAGQVIATLDERPLRQDLDSARAARRVARARRPRAGVDVKSARRRVEIEKNAVASGTSARRLLEEAQFALESARAARGEVSATVAQARMRVDQARARLARSAVRAPFDGVIAARYRDAGAAVGPLAPVVRLVGGGGPRLRFAVTPDDSRGLGPGAAVLVDTPMQGKPIQAVVEQIAPEVDQPSQMIFIDAALDPSAAGLQPGLAVRVRRADAQAAGQGADRLPPR